MIDKYEVTNSSTHEVMPTKIFLEHWINQSLHNTGAPTSSKMTKDGRKYPISDLHLQRLWKVCKRIPNITTTQ